MSKCNDTCLVELTDVYDFNKKRTGEVVPRHQMKEGRFRLVVQMCIFSKDKLLIQKRCMSKRSFPGAWDISAAGQVDAGEESHEGASREVREELGLEYILTEKDLFVTLRLPHVFNDIYIIEYDGSEITIQESEVDDFGWATEEEVLNMIDDGRFIPYKPELIRLIFEAHRKGIRNAPDMCMETSYI